MELKDLTAVLALLVAVVALIYSKAQWRQSNRPLVTAFVEEHATGNMAATFKEGLHKSADLMLCKM